MNPSDLIFRDTLEDTISALSGVIEAPEEYIRFIAAGEPDLPPRTSTPGKFETYLTNRQAAASSGVSDHSAEITLVSIAVFNRGHAYR